MAKRPKLEPLNTSREVWGDSQLGEKDFKFFQRQIQLRFGITLQDSKATFIEARLKKRIMTLGFGNFSEYRSFLSSHSAGGDEWQFVINCLTTHTTEWFREIDHFKELRDQFIPHWLSAGISRPLRVWSVACSTGEEAYSIALVLNYFHARNGLNYEVTATDIDTQVLEIAKKGLYSVESLRRIPSEYHEGALAQGVGDSSDWMKVRQHIREKVSFSQFNLSKEPYSMNGRFDLIFCRNVLIYFSPEVITRVAQGLFQLASPGAVLLTGHSETLTNLSVAWKFVKPTYYVKPGDLK